MSKQDLARESVSLLIPIYNEEENIERTIKLVSDNLEKNFDDWEILAVNDGSIDKTAMILKRLSTENHRLKVLNHERNYGQGKALETGFKNASKDFVISIDSDLSFPLEYIQDIITSLKTGTDVVIGSYYLEGSKIINVPLWRIVVSKTGNLIYRLVFPTKLSSYTSNFRGYKREVVQNIDISFSGFQGKVEILANLILNGCKVKEVKVDLHSRKKGKSKFKITDIIGHILLLYRILLWRLQAKG